MSIENVIGSNFNATLTGAAEIVKNILDGGAGNDILSSGDFSNTVLNGGAGNDTLTGEEHGSYLLNGGRVTIRFTLLPAATFSTATMATTSSSVGGLLSVPC